MILRKAEVIGHFDGSGTRHAIYSMDFQPNGSRLATCGGDSSVKLWAMNSLMGSAKEAQESLLTTLTNHSKPVNVVRWSGDGRLLASGSDDNYILIHRYAPGGFSNQSFGSTQVTIKNKENWIRCCTLQGHSMDVLDLDWSANNTLVSGSVDNHIMLWDVAGCLAQGRAIMSPTRILTGHRSFVKGVAFDPLGRYLVSCGSDNIIIVWDSKPRQSGSSGGGSSYGHHHSQQQGPWHVVRELTAPMRGTSDKSMFRRLSWSPDGRTVCFSGCLKSGKPVGTVLRRDTWDSAGGSACDLVGHEAPTVCSRYCPYVLDSRNVSPQISSDDKLSTTESSLIGASLIEDACAKDAETETVAMTTEESGGEDTPQTTEPVSVDSRQLTPSSPLTLAVAVAPHESPIRCSSRSRRLETKVVSVAASAVDASPAISVVSTSSPADETSGPVQTKGPFCLVALGDQQGVLSLWTPGRSDRAVLVLRHVFARNQPITDVSWVRSGRSDQQQLYLACCSIDGCVLLVDLSVLGDALFRPLNPQEMITHRASTTADGVLNGVSNHFEVPLRPHAAFSSSASNLSTSTTSVIPSTLTASKNGKKRIQPVLLQLPNGQAPSVTTCIVASNGSVDSLVSHFSRGLVSDVSTGSGVAAIQQTAAAAVIDVVLPTDVVIDSKDVISSDGVSTTNPETSISTAAVVGKKRLRFADDDEHQSSSALSAPSLSSASQSSSVFGGPSRPTNGGMVINDLNGMVRRKGGPGCNAATYYSPTRLVHMQQHGQLGGQSQNGSHGNMQTQHASRPATGSVSRPFGSNSHTNGTHGNNTPRPLGSLANGAFNRYQPTSATPPPPPPAAAVAKSVVVQHRYLSVRLEGDDVQVCALPLPPVDGVVPNLSCAVKEAVSAGSAEREEKDVTQTLSLSVNPRDGVVVLSNGEAVELWRTVLTLSRGVVVTSVSASRLQSDIRDTSSPAASVNGLVAVGCSDGSLHLLSLCSGVRVTAGPLVLGSAVAFCDVNTSPSPNGVLRVLAVTMTGDVQLWDVTMTQSSPVTARLKAVSRTSLRPLLTSIRTTDRLAHDLTVNKDSECSTVAVSSTSTKEGGNNISSSTAFKVHSKHHHHKHVVNKVSPLQLQVHLCSLTVSGGVSVSILATRQSTVAAGVDSVVTGSEVLHQFTYCVEAEAWIATSGV